MWFLFFRTQYSRTSRSPRPTRNSWHWIWGECGTLIKETTNGTYMITHLILYTLIRPMVLNVPAGGFPEVLWYNDGYGTQTDWRCFDLHFGQKRSLPQSSGRCQTSDGIVLIFVHTFSFIAKIVKMHSIHKLKNLIMIICWKKNCLPN